MAKIKYFIRTSKKSSAANIRIRFTQGRLFDIFANSQKSIDPQYWNNTKGDVRQRIEFKDGSKLQEDLDLLATHITKEFSKVSDKSKIDNEWLTQIIDHFYFPEKYVEKTESLFHFIQNFIDHSDTRLNLKTGTPVCYKMRREYQVTFNYLKEYALKVRKLDFIDIDLEFYNQFVDFLRKKGLAQNTIGKKIQTLKIFLNSAYEQGVNPYTKYKSRNFKTLTEESENIYLNEDEIQKFYNFDFSGNERLEKVRDLFIVACWTGFRFSDISQVTNENIKDEIISIRQTKTKDKVSVPVHPIVKAILDKYDNELPKPISNQKFNNYLKEAAQLAGIDEIVKKSISHKGMKVEKSFHKFELISSHSGRRSFCTNAYKMGIPTLAIMSISGHKTEKAFLKYIKADDKDHAHKVLEAWKKSSNHLKVVSKN